MSAIDHQARLARLLTLSAVHGLTENRPLHPVKLQINEVKDVRLLLFAPEENVAFETSNLLLQSQHCSVTLKAASPEANLGRKHPQKNPHSVHVPHLLEIIE